ncbi:MAG: ABC transporter permease [Eubacterium sp.]|nr:ABC transporter permease [Eubacterium sp.]
MEKKKKNPFLVFLEKGGISIILLILIWGIGSLFYTVDFLPSPVETIKGGEEIIRDGTLWNDVVVSMGRVLKGWILGVVVAVPLGLLIGTSKTVSTLIEPIITFFRFVPAIGFITLFLLWFGVGEESKVALIFYATIFPVIVNTASGVRGIDRSLLEASGSLGGSKAYTFFHVILPSATPGIFTGVRLGLSGAIICIVAAEMLAASSGLGYLIYTSRIYYRTDWIFIGIFTLGLIGFLVDQLMQLFGRTVLKRFNVH